MTLDYLEFSEANNKTAGLEQRLRRLKKRPYGKLYSLSLLAGWSCPGASFCLAKVHDRRGQRTLETGPKAQIRCFSASQELQYTHTYAQRHRNWQRLFERRRSAAQMAELIDASIPDNAIGLRIHISGDFFNYNYLAAWADVARRRSTLLIYAYTKSLPFVLKAADAGLLPPNLRLILSEGGKYDSLIPELKARGFQTARVVYSKQEARRLKLRVDHDDTIAALGQESFALLLHGPQPACSVASQAIVALKAEGFTGYGR